MSPATRSRCRAEISRPMWVPSASGSPATVSMTTVSRCPRNSSTAACSTKTRRAGTAVLARVAERASAQTLRRGLQVGVGEDNRGRLPAQL